MRTFLFQCSTLMMVILVYSSPCNRTNKLVCKKLLKQIKQEALKLSTEVPNSVRVPNLSSRGQKCVPHFFCLAEKVVQNITNKPVEDKLSRLQEHLVQYNNLTQDHNCKVTSSSTIPIPYFLEQVASCADYATLNRRATT